MANGDPSTPVGDDGDDAPKSLEEQERSAAGAAGARAGVRASVMAAGKHSGRFLVPRAAVGRLPRRLPVRRVAQLSDQVGTLVDVATLVHRHSPGTTPSDQKESRGSHTVHHGAMRRPPGLLQRMWGVMRAPLEEFVKATVLGTLLFETFSTVIDSDDIESNFNSNDAVSGAALHAVLAGTAAGAAHGVGTHLWEVGATVARHSHEAGLEAWRRTPPSQAFTHRYVSPRLERVGHSLPLRDRLRHSFVPGVMTSNIITHGLVFFTYEMSKGFLLGALQSHPEMEECHHHNTHGTGAGLAMVAICGSIAGVTGEVISHYLSPNEPLAGLAPSRYAMWSIITSRSAPGLGAVLRGSVATAVGFVAYEYGRDTILAGHEDGDDFVLS